MSSALQLPHHIYSFMLDLKHL